jgi:hypothetical protein
VSDGYDTHVGATRGVGTTTTAATDPLGAVADTVPEPPNAGTATGTVIDFMQSLAETMAGLTQQVEATGQQVTGAVNTYVGDDGAAAGNVGAVDVPSGPAG